MGQGGIKFAAVFAAVSLSAGCAGDMGELPFVSRLNTGGGDATAPVSQAALRATPTKHDETLNTESVVLQNLLARRSVLPEGSAYETVATSVLAANAVRLKPSCARRVCGRLPHRRTGYQPLVRACR